MEKKMRWLALALAFLFVLVPMQVNADEVEEVTPITETTEPEVSEPEVTEPEVTKPEATEPEVIEPEVTEPEATEPEVTEPEATEPAGDEEKTPFLEELWAIIVHYWGVVSEWFMGVVHDIYLSIQGQ